MVKPSIKLSSESQDLLRVLNYCQPKIRNAILKNCENNLIHIICDCVYNVVKENVPGLTQEKVNEFALHKKSLIKLTKKVPIKKEKDSCSERFFHFCFLPFLLPLVAPLTAKALRKIA